MSTYRTDEAHEEAKALVAVDPADPSQGCASLRHEAEGTRFFAACSTLRCATALDAASACDLYTMDIRF